MFVLMQLVGGVLGYALIRALYPDPEALAAELTAPRPDTQPDRPDKEYST
jgi:hypothetical protein